MRRLPFHRLISSLAVLALLMNLFAPGVSGVMQARAAAQALWGEICSVNAPRSAMLISGGAETPTLSSQAANTSEPGAPAALHHAACDYCLAHAASFLLPWPEAAAPIWPSPVLGAVWVGLAREAQRPALEPWRSPAVRAPPFFA